ncbi:MAG: hypothetical protein V1838_01325 [Patescibacteria group bacterium]
MSVMAKKSTYYGWLYFKDQAGKTTWQTSFRLHDPDNIVPYDMFLSEIENIISGNWDGSEGEKYFLYLDSEVMKRSVYERELHLSNDRNKGHFVFREGPRYMEAKPIADRDPVPMTIKFLDTRFIPW